MENQTKKIVLVTRNIPGEDFSSLEPDFKVLIPEKAGEFFQIEKITESLPDVFAIIGTSTVNSELIAKCLNLKLIITNGSGYENIDIGAATAVKVPVYNVPEVTAFPTAELTVTLMLNLFRRASEMNMKLKESEESHVSDFFMPGSYAGHTLEGKTIGIIGMGCIGKKVAHICDAFYMNILYTQHHKLSFNQENNMRFVSLDKLLNESDVVSIHCRLNKDTAGMIGSEEFSKMKKSAFLINTSRGAIVDQEALISDLQNGTIAGAGLDVFTNEPEIPETLRKMDNVIITPHIGSNTTETRPQMSQAIIKIIRDAAEGKSIRRIPINPEIYANPTIENEVSKDEPTKE